MQECADLLVRHRGRPEVALSELAAQIVQALELVLGLDPFGEHRHAEFVAERDDRLEQCIVARALDGRADEGLVDLDDHRMQQCEVGERGVTRAEVVERQTDAERAERSITFIVSAT